MNDEEAIRKLEEEINIIQAQWPAHSVPPGMLQKLDELEEALEILKKKNRTKENDA